MRVLILPGTISEGFVYLPRVEGGRYVDIRLQADAYEETAARHVASRLPGDSPRARELRFEFGIALPDGDFDYERLDTHRVYSGQTLQDLTADELRSTLEQLACCAGDADGRAAGDPLNVVLVGERDLLLGALGRSGWSLTHRITAQSVRREIGAALAGEPYAGAQCNRHQDRD